MIGNQLTNDARFHQNTRQCSNLLLRSKFEAIYDKYLGVRMYLTAMLRRNSLDVVT